MAVIIAAGAAFLGATRAAYLFFKTSNKIIQNMNELQPGDHIKFGRGLYSHHAVVVDINSEKDAYTVIHFSGEKKSGLPAEIKEETFNFEPNKITLIRYRYDRLDRSSTVELAYRLLKLQETTHIIYNILTNNCEHFATWCVTGKATSVQVNKALAPFAPYINIVGESKRPYKDLRL